MKKILWILLSSMSISLTGATFGCKGFDYGWGSPGLKPPPEPPEEEKNKDYYLQLREKNQKLYEKSKKEVDELNLSSSIKEVCGSSKMCAELQDLIDANKVEMYGYLAIVHDCYYHIFLLENEGKFPDKKTREKAMDILQDEIDALKEQLKLMIEASDPYREDEIERVKNSRKACDEIYQKLKKENEKEDESNK